MPWCPNCKTEYREGFTHCADCGADLVPTLPDEAPEPETLDRPTEAVMLMHCPSTLEADATVALLQSFSIPCFAQPDMGAEKAYTGFCLTGGSIFVDRQAWQGSVMAAAKSAPKTADVCWKKPKPNRLPSWAKTMGSSSRARWSVFCFCCICL